VGAAAEAVPARERRPSLVEVARFFAVISATSFGGGQKASIRRDVVRVGKWMTDDEFIEGLEIAQIMPGPNILNLAVYCGQRARGLPGAIVAFLAASVPPFAIVLAAGALYFSKYNTPLVHAMLAGCAAGAVGLTLANAIELSADHRSAWIDLAFIAVTALAVSLLHLSLVLTLVVIGGLSMWRYAATHRRKAAA
jgi:chromate transporter